MFKVFSSLFQKSPFDNSTDMIIDAEEVSNECFAHVFHRLDKKSLLNCMLTCHRFEGIISSDSFWVEQARMSKPTVLPSLAWRRAVSQKKFDEQSDPEVDVSNFKFNLKRMVTSGRGYSQIVPLFESHFENARENTINGVLRSDDFSIRAPANGIRMEVNGGEGCQPHPEVSRCFAFSFSSGAIIVFIDLVNSGIDPWVLDHVRPKIRITQKVNHRHDCSARLSFAAQLNYNETQWIQEMGMRQTDENLNLKRFKSTNKEWQQWSENEWEDWSIEFDDYPSGMRHLTVLNEGKDGQYWAGFYGPKVANIQVQVVMPEIPIVKSLDVDAEKCREDEAPVQLEDEQARPGRFRVPIMQRRRHMWGIPPAVARQQEDDE